jgi:TonB family protein
VALPWDRAARGAALTLCCVLAAPSQESHASLAPIFQIPPSPKLETLAQLDDAIDNVHRMSWQLFSRAQPNEQGASVARDVDRWLLTPEREQRLESLHGRAQTESAKGDTSALHATLTEAAALLQQEGYRATVLNQYWGFQQLVALHETNLRALEAGLPQDDRASRESRIGRVADSLRAQLAGAMSADSWPAQVSAIEQLNTASQSLLDVYNEERGTVAEQVDSRERAQGKENSIHLRDSACPEQAPKSSGHEFPSLAAGNVTVQAWVSATGCMEKAQIYASSGVDALDEAAIRWTQQAKFLPAESNHKPVDATMRFRVRFKLTD